MTTIIISRDGDRLQVFGLYVGEDDRYVFGIRSYYDAGMAESYAGTLKSVHDAIRIDRVA